MLEIRVRQDSLIILSHHSNFNTALPLWWGELNWMRLLTQSYYWVQFSSVQFSCSVVSDSLRPHELQHTKPPCPSPSPGVHSNSCPSGRWCHPAIWSSIVPFSSCPQSLPASESFPTSQLLSLQHLTMKNYFNLLNTRGLREQSFASCPVSQDLIKVTEHE